MPLADIRGGVNGNGACPSMLLINLKSQRRDLNPRPLVLYQLSYARIKEPTTGFEPATAVTPVLFQLSYVGIRCPETVASGRCMYIACRMKARVCTTVGPVFDGSRSRTDPTYRGQVI